MVSADATFSVVRGDIATDSLQRRSPDSACSGVAAKARLRSTAATPRRNVIETHPTQENRPDRCWVPSIGEPTLERKNATRRAAFAAAKDAIH